MWIGVGIAVIFIAVLTLYYFFDPAQSSYFPQCPSKMITGYDCPGCGSQRAVHAALQGDWRMAFWFNPLLFVLVPFAILVGVFEYVPQLRFHPFRQKINHPLLIMGVFVVIVLFTIWRNI
ncbi:DUF2752 domain-containing protein [Nonlabens xiamenensis]|uniref:DUF2752 domain-containing protein n=1 Tax=Nonlabens xiamenensis TaxID=2341043 RepID=UPI0013DE0C61|nr:DUF2752 domain-containing protein [Nonlabens xiamenensis]